MREDREAREIVRQARTSGAGNRLSAASGGSVSATTGSTSPRIDTGGKVVRLFLPDTDPLNDSNFFLGDEPLPELL